MDTTSCQSADKGHFQRAEDTKGREKVPCVFHAKVALKLAGMPAKYRGTYKKAMTGKSLRAGANAFCLECVGWQREEVRLCTSPACPLYPYRPYQGTRKADADE